MQPEILIDIIQLVIAESLDIFKIQTYQYLQW